MLATRTISRAGAVLGVACLGAAPSRQMAVSFTDALTYYELGEYDAVARGLRASIAGDPDRVIPMLARDAEAWIKADGAAEVPRRRLVAATFALELGLSGIDTQWEVTTQAIEWACTLLRRSGPPTELERQWQLAALALLEATFIPPSSALPEALALPAHIGHVNERFPKEPRLALARALDDEFEFWARHVALVPGGLTRHDDSLAAGAIGALTPAAAQPDTRAEARLRLGILEQHRGNHDLALTHLAAAAEGNDDPTRTYLAHLVSGWAYERTGRTTEAMAAYRRALATLNGLSAALGLGILLYADDERDEADRIVTAALAAGIEDPWKKYGYGDFRRLTQLIARLRAAVAR